jgi:cytochrome c peroxidase
MDRIAIFVAIFLAIVVATKAVPLSAQEWSGPERKVLRTLWIGSLPPLPNDPSNRVADDARAAGLGRVLFFDKRLSSNGNVACSTCHQPDKGFADGLALAQGVGLVPRHTPTIIGIAYSPWFFWDGRKDSQWSQALGPMESPVEHGITRTLIAKILFADTYYSQAYEEIFGRLPDLSDSQRFPGIAAPIDVPESRIAWEAMNVADRRAVSRIYANIGKAIAAYERLVLPGASRFDRYVKAVLDGDKVAQKQLFNADEAAGLRLFIGRGNCTRCHNGPLFTNHDFHNTGIPATTGAQGNSGRAAGVKMVLQDEFNCLGPFSDAAISECQELRFAKVAGDDLIGSFKTPTLRNVAKTAPYMHEGQLATLNAVIDFYNRAPSAKPGHSELEPLGLSKKEIGYLEDFLRTLDGPVSAPQ